MRATLVTGLEVSLYLWSLMRAPGRTRQRRREVWSRKGVENLRPRAAVVRNNTDITVQNFPGCSSRNNISPCKIYRKSEVRGEEVQPGLSLTSLTRDLRFLRNVWSSGADRTSGWSGVQVSGSLRKYF